MGGEHALKGNRSERHPLTRRTAQLPVASRWLYKIDHHSSRPSASLVVVGILLCLLAIGIILGFPPGWVVASEVGMSATTLVMVFAIQRVVEGPRFRRSNSVNKVASPLG